MTDPLDYYRQSWTKKPLLRRVYNDIYDRIAAACVSGKTLEIGGGIGQFKTRFPHVIATDIQSAPWLDLVADAQKLPFADGSFDNIVMVDVLHHIEFPVLFLREADPTVGGHFRRIVEEQLQDLRDVSAIGCQLELVAQRDAHRHSYQRPMRTAAAGHAIILLL